MIKTMILAKMMLQILVIFMMLAFSVNGKAQSTIKRPLTVKTNQGKNTNSSKRKTSSNANSRHNTQEYDVRILCNAPGASLCIDGYSCGLAEGTKRIKKGNHRFSVTSIGYEDYSASIYIDSSTNTLTFNMKDATTYSEILNVYFQDEKIHNIRVVNYNSYKLKKYSLVIGSFGMSDNAEDLAYKECGFYIRDETDARDIKYRIIKYTSDNYQDVLYMQAQIRSTYPGSRIITRR